MRLAAGDSPIPAGLGVECVIRRGGGVRGRAADVLRVRPLRMAGGGRAPLLALQGQGPGRTPRGAVVAVSRPTAPTGEKEMLGQSPT
mmetsp:Transcript_25156/g.38943  ORF Transcript_25156/g.38943 Transcript_25156/m.38943 type:complete len:87 (-) Transcript_25156:150-410(-)